MADKQRVVFDTNIIISAVVFGGPPRLCLEFAREGRVELFITSAILLELSRILAKKFDWERESIEKLIKALSETSHVIEVVHKINTIISDDSDNRILEAAAQARAHLIVSGDKRHILPLKKYKKTKIITAAEFLKQI